MPKPRANKAAPTSAKVMYPKFEVKTFVGEDAITVEMMKELLGWTEEKDGEKFGEDYLLKDEEGAKIRCLNNTKNRPLSEGWCRTIAQDHLMKNWVLNGETIIIGTSGQFLSGQHRGISLILAEQIRNGPQKLHWKDNWPGPVTMECVIVFGVDESSKTTRTLDNVKPRTLADVLFCDNTIFGAKVAPGDRKTLCKLADSAVKMLWSRTGAGDNAFSGRKTHSAALDFIDRHPRILKCVKHIWEENQPDRDDDGKIGPPKIGRYVAPGYAAGLLYLMGCSASDGDRYRNSDNPGEKKLDWSLMDKAEEFWVLLAGGAAAMLEVHYAFAALCDPDTGVGKGTIAEQTAIIARAWKAYASKGKITKADVSLEDAYITNDEGVRRFKEVPDFGGIDCVDEVYEDDTPTPAEEEGEGEQTNGYSASEDQEDTGSDFRMADDPPQQDEDQAEMTDEEMERRKAEERQNRINMISGRHKERQKAKQEA